MEGEVVVGERWGREVEVEAREGNVSIFLGTTADFFPFSRSSSNTTPPHPPFPPHTPSHPTSSIGQRWYAAKTRDPEDGRGRQEGGGV